MAITAEQQQTGMMFRTNMAENEGMIFVFPDTERAVVLDEELHAAVCPSLTSMPTARFRKFTISSRTTPTR